MNRHTRDSRLGASPRRLAAAALLAGLLATACGVDADSEPRVIPEDDLRASQSEDVTTTTASDTRDNPIGDPVPASVYFARAGADDGDRAELVTAERHVSAPATEDRVLDALLLEPPTARERTAGLVTAIPATTRQVRPPRDEGEGVVLVSLTSGLFDVEGQSLKVAFGQIVCSVTSLGRARRVLIEVDGDLVPVIDGSGQQVDEPVGCEAYADLEPG